MKLLKIKHLIILTILICFASVSGVLFTPALPELANYFHISDSQIQWTVSLYLAGYTLGQLPYGPLANRLGRKKALFFGLGLAFIGCILCLLATEFWMLCLGRFLQALGAAAGLKLSYTMIGDSCEGPSAVKAISFIALSFSIAPGIAVAIGGSLVVLSGWQSCFAFLAIYTLGLSLLCSFLPETGPPIDLEALKGSKIVQGLLTPLKNRSLLLLALIYGLGTSIIYVFSAGAPYIGIQQMNLLPNVYGLWSLLPSLGLGIGLFFTRYLAHGWPSNKGMLSGLLLSLLGICFLAVLLILLKTPSSLFFPMILIFAGIGITATFASGKILSTAKDKSNTSAIMGFLNMGTATLWLFGIAPLAPLSPGSLIAIFYAIILIAFFTIFYLIKSDKKSSTF